MFGFLKVVKPIVAEPGKLSDAILAGAKIRAQASHSYTGAEGDRSCALAAAYEACKGKLPKGFWQVLSVPYVLKCRFKVPIWNIVKAITWNDTYGMTREDIAAQYKRLGY